ncbi:hypothetical protein N481_21910 [Pseudoalteromonas luteoviolacea S4047-1]|uniref:Uncharacterized protein n=1 Tax=Pseudoalteromonas luteoviolacea S4054 TaxID=1129367 RepID=A0A0F6A8K4_9GAMM|nr:hypothetical protein N479_19475 [Pseudoalteromonas luteoviolacea S4054]KZN69708.1 hypothetical protein N481_21910 [Pseudoalteromonas luteoviolacea S4047-1]
MCSILGYINYFILLNNCFFATVAAAKLTAKNAS